MSRSCSFLKRKRPIARRSGQTWAPSKTADNRARPPMFRLLHQHAYLAAMIADPAAPSNSRRHRSGDVTHATRHADKSPSARRFNRRDRSGSSNARSRSGDAVNFVPENDEDLRRRDAPEGDKATTDFASRMIHAFGNEARRSKPPRSVATGSDDLRSGPSCLRRRRRSTEQPVPRITIHALAIGHEIADVIAGGPTAASAAREISVESGGIDWRPSPASPASQPPTCPSSIRCPPASQCRIGSPAQVIEEGTRSSSSARSTIIASSAN